MSFRSLNPIPLFPSTAKPRVARRVVSIIAGSLLMVSCTSSSSTDSTINSSRDSTLGGVGDTSADATTSAQAITIPADAVAIDYFVASGDAPLLKETLVPLSAPTKSVAMIVNKITYAGVVCGFSFTGPDRPKPPLAFRMQIEQADGTVTDATVDVDWDGDAEKAASATAPGWSFLSDAQVNRNGPGWVVQVGAVATAGGKNVDSPKRALCTATSETEMPVSVGPVAYWAGFAIR
jgi:hypothetical protein